MGSLFLMGQQCQLFGGILTSGTKTEAKLTVGFLFLLGYKQFNKTPREVCYFLSTKYATASALNKLHSTVLVFGITLNSLTDLSLLHSGEILSENTERANGC